MAGRHQIKFTISVFITQVTLNWNYSSNFADEISVNFYLSCKDIVNKVAGKENIFMDGRKINVKYVT